MHPHNARPVTIEFSGVGLGRLGADAWYTGGGWGTSQQQPAQQQPAQQQSSGGGYWGLIGQGAAAVTDIFKTVYTTETAKGQAQTQSDLLAQQLAQQQQAQQQQAQQNATMLAQMQAARAGGAGGGIPTWIWVAGGAGVLLAVGIGIFALRR